MYINLKIQILYKECLFTKFDKFLEKGLKNVFNLYSYVKMK